MRAKPVSPAQAGLPIATAQTPRVARTGAPGDKLKDGAGSSPAGWSTPGCQEDAGAGPAELGGEQITRTRKPVVGCDPGGPADTGHVSDVAIYELTTLVGPWPRWLCPVHAKKRAGQSPKRLDGPTVAYCDDCLRNERQAKGEA